ncbi:alpha/beta hydrolase family protein [Roseateles oligotrophus]|uniref:Prolyl oligopeptidase family serine peptidase n=1 Tax=Roseateles oligotrophus TaxID=1769250 RepID=A0ABT2YF22_9BURK|nr:prolyl oligopeptidase family serine peptidase [Roseateles oligotrophus]MCV2368626.1 prolyl oligopeptidase family serine peptidase [Roseateles oligotrophus]
MLSDPRLLLTRFNYCTHRLLLGASLLIAGLAALAAPQQSAYQQPSPAVRDLLDAAASPKHLISPNKQHLAMLELRRFSSLAELARPTLRLAGLRFDQASGVPSQTAAIQRLRLRPLLNPQAPELVVDLNAGGPAGKSYFHSFSWAPDGQRFLLERRTDLANELWVGDAGSGQLQKVAGLRLNNALAQGELAWLNPSELVLLAQVERRGAAPKLPPVPSAPLVRETSGRASPERTHADLLQTPHDERLLEYHALSQLTRINLRTMQSKRLGEPALFFSVASLGDADALLTERITRPFSYSLTWDDFPQVVEVRRPDGTVMREIARLPLKRGVAINGVLPGPRLFYASPNKDAAVYWVEALDGGNPNNRAAHRDHLMRLDAPYTGEAQELLRLPHRFKDMRFLDDGLHALVSEDDAMRAWTRSYLFPLRGGSIRTVFDHSMRERYGHPGAPVMRISPNGHMLAQTQGGGLLLIGAGASPKGDRPFLDRLSLRDASVQRLFQSGEAIYSQPLELLNESQLLTLQESINTPPALFTQSLTQPNAPQALTRARAPHPLMRKIRRELVSFKRSDGVDMSFWMYLPPDYKEGEARPTLVWAYPLEFNDASLAGQVSGSANRYPNFNGISPLMLVLDGYVVLNEATMPIVGDAKAVNDEFIEQITLSARAIIDKAEDLGVTDPKRVAIGGHSYGAFMAVNLLAHTDLFKAGIARSGAYNRTLTPFGFQSERRSLWDARDTYLKLSPFLYANQIKEPLLLIHGDADDRAGTIPMQSERLYQALAGTGGTARYVLLPLEAHGYNARESVGHVQWEMRQWLKTHLGEPKASH